MHNSFLNNTKKQFLPMGLGAFVVWLNVEKYFIFVLNVAYTISKFYLNLCTVKFIFTNKALNVVANTLKPLKTTLLEWFFLCKNLTNVNFNSQSNNNLNLKL